jgi:hypothetical protein
VYREMLGAFLENEELMVLGKGLLVYYIWLWAFGIRNDLDFPCGQRIYNTPPISDSNMVWPPLMLVESTTVYKPVHVALPSSHLKTFQHKGWTLPSHDVHNTQRTTAGFSCKLLLTQSYATSTMYHGTGPLCFDLLSPNSESNQQPIPQVGSANGGKVIIHCSKV